MKIKFLFLLICVSPLCNGQVKYTYFSKKALEQDLLFFSEKLTSIHPKFMDKSYCSKWESEFADINKSLKDSMIQNEFYLIVSPFLAYLNDAHSNFLCPFDQRKQYMMSGGLAFPFALTIANNSIYISEYYGNDSILFKGGEEILEINAIKSSLILNEMQKLIGSNAVSIRNKTIQMNFRSYLWMIYGFENDYELLLRNEPNKTYKIVVKGITNDQYLNNKKRYINQQEELYSLLQLEKNKTAILTIRSFADLKGFCYFADSAFQVIKKNDIKNLIIDVRGNGGGRSIVVDSLMNYLTSKPYAQYQKIETRISNDLKAYYKEKYPEKYNEIKDFKINELLTTLGDTSIPLNNNYRYKGNLFLLTSNTTFSAAATFAGLFKELKLGTIIGEETGGTIEYYGDFWYITLPNTGLQFHISPKRFVQYGGTNMEKGVMPDFVVPNKNDSIVNFTINLIAKGHNNKQ